MGATDEASRTAVKNMRWLCDNCHASIYNLHVALLIPSFSVLPPLHTRIMSEKIQEFLEIPQEFIRDGNQVRHFILVTPIGFSHHLIPVSCPVYKTLSKRSSRRFLSTTDTR